jgi:nickel-dependent lactate racemase
VEAVVREAFEAEPLEGMKWLCIIPDGTRSAPLPMLFQLLNEQIAARADRLDYLIALGTHPPMQQAAIERLLGISTRERVQRYPNVEIFNHRWDREDALTSVGTIPSEEMETLTEGWITDPSTVMLNKMIFEYDHLLLCGPVFPHEVAGFSGGAKYLFPGIAGAEIINHTHWLGALVTNLETIGRKDTPVRRVIHRAAEFVDLPLTCLTLAMDSGNVHGVFIGTHLEAFEAAADLSAQINVISKASPFREVLSMPAKRYDDLWTAAKAMYKTEPVVAKDGEVIIYAPHLKEVSVTHGRLIRQIGYHVRDYFLKQWEEFRHIPWAILAHSTHVKGVGSFHDGIEEPRIKVTLATGIPKEECEAINLGYRDPRSIHPEDWEGRENDGRLIVRNAGEYLFQLEGYA